MLIHGVLFQQPTHINAELKILINFHYEKNKNNKLFNRPN